MKKTLIIALAASMVVACGPKSGEPQSVRTPGELYGPLFERVMSDDGLFGDGKLFVESKTFMDCTPNLPMEDVLAAYKKEKPKTTEELEAFILKYFQVPVSMTADFADSSDIVTHIQKLWKVLRREPQASTFESTLIPLPKGYVVPGGRFREVYYWDSYFTMLGLMVDGELDTMFDMVDNFASLIDRVGFIPNGNRTYYGGRSQPPYFSHMVEILSSADDAVVARYLPQIEKEYKFWMETQHAVTLPDGEVLNRYCDKYDTPREESYRDDLKTYAAFKEKNPDLSPSSLFRSLRSAAESGWDFSSRWMADFTNLYTVHTTDFIPVDLNCLLYHMEVMLSLVDDSYAEAAKARRDAILKYCWDEESGWFMDYDFVAGKRTGHFSLAGMYPLFAGIATEEQAAKAAEKFEADFLKAGGAVTTNYPTGEQWDSPNGWAPLQWISYTGLMNYGYEGLADTLRDRWMGMVEKVYAEKYKLLEKYNVLTASNTGGGEYANQDGFGWTNGVYRAFCATKEQDACE